MIAKIKCLNSGCSRRNVSGMMGNNKLVDKGSIEILRSGLSKTGRRCLVCLVGRLTNHFRLLPKFDRSYYDSFIKMEIKRKITCLFM